MPLKKLNILSRLDSVSARFLINALDHADVRGLRHGFCVAEVCYALGRAADDQRSSPDELWLAGLLHDIGHLGLRKDITDKWGKLTKSERHYMEQHPKFSKFIVEHLFTAPDLAHAILCHHERPDGKGYPLKLAGNDVPFASRVIAIADAYDAMRTTGWLMGKKNHEQAMVELKAGASTQFDAALVNHFLRSQDSIQAFYNAAKNVKVVDMLARL